MSKKFKDKICVYCNDGKSTKSGDHIFPRKLFLERRRGDLPKVACCQKCNNKKSQLEHYLLTILPFGATHEDAIENLSSLVPGRLAQNISLHEKLYNRQSIEYVKNENGVIEPYMSLPFNSSKLIELFNFISRALTFHHFSVKIDENDLAISAVGYNIDSFIKGKAKNRIDVNLGNGTVVYKGVQALDNEKITAWEFYIYGGLKVDHGNPKNVASLTGPKKMLDNVQRKIQSIYGSKT